MAENEAVASGGEAEPTGAPDEPTPEASDNGLASVVWPDGTPCLDAVGVPILVPRGTRIVEPAAPVGEGKDDGEPGTIPDGYVELHNPDGEPFLINGRRVRVPRGTYAVAQGDPWQGVTEPGVDWTPHATWRKHPGPGYV